MKELKDQLQKTIREIPKFDELQNHIDMTVTNEGLRIELTEIRSGVFFDSGSDRMSGDGGDLVTLLAQELGKLPDSIAIEGHTDSKPYPPGCHLHELGAFFRSRQLDAANNAKHVDCARTRSRKCVASRTSDCAKQDAPLDPSNRRISLIVQYLAKSRRRREPQKGKSGTTNRKAESASPPVRNSGWR